MDGWCSIHTRSPSAHLDADCVFLIEDKYEVSDHYRRGGSKEYNTEEPEEKGLPDLKYGDINSELPADWELVHHPHMGNFYSGNVRSTLQVRFSSRFR
jgi:hypothetical protein